MINKIITSTTTKTIPIIIMNKIITKTKTTTTITIIIEINKITIVEVKTNMDIKIQETTMDKKIEIIIRVKER